jgi:hypothetical protein
MFGLKSTGWCGLDPWLTIHSILTSFFLATAQQRRRKERHVWRIYTAASRFYSAATNGRRAAKFAWGVAWPFGRKTLPVEKSSEFKFKFDLTDLGGVGRRWICQRAYFPSGYVPLDQWDHMLSQKLLKDVGVDTFAGKNRCLAEIYRRFPLLFRGDGRT